MKIAIVNNWAPFIYGGAEFLADKLKNKLIEYGHETELYKIPFKWTPSQSVLEHAFASQLIDFKLFDKVITFKYPAYLIKHSNKTIWLLHQFRQAYDLWGTQYQDIPNTFEGKKIRQIIINSDNNAFKEAKKIFTNSKIVSSRLKKYNNIESQILYPPPIEEGVFNFEKYGDFIFYPSRLSRGKRQILVIQAMAYVQSKVSLIIAGNPDDIFYLHEMSKTVKNLKLNKKVKIIPTFISQKEKIDLLSKCLGCVYTPYKEDSYGYVTMESYQAKKPVISCTDSGDIDVLVKDNQTGFLTEPTPQSIAKAIDMLFTNKKLAKRFGENGFELLQSLDITWKNVINKLIST